MEKYKNIAVSAADALSQIREEYPFVPKKLDTGGGRMLSYVEEGTGSPVLLLHAFPMWSFSFRKVIRFLSENHRVIAPDFLGCGLSDKPADYEYSIDNNAADIEKLFDSLSLQNAAMVLHGWSVMPGLKFLFRHPDKVKDIVLLNSAAFSGYRMPYLIRFLSIWPWLATKAYMLMNFFSPAFLRLPPEVRTGYLLPLRMRGGRRAFRYFVEHFPYHPESFTFSQMVTTEHRLWLLQHYHTAVIWSGGDWMYPEKYLDYWRKFCPGLKLFQMQRAGRFMLESAPDEIAAILHAFISSGGRVK